LGLEDDDFYQIFCLKALQATRTYSPERGKWITYVSCCLRGAVSNALREYLEVVQFETQISKWSAIEAAVGDRRQRSHEVVEVSLDAEAILQRLGSRDRAALGRMFGLDGVAELRAFEEAAEAGVSASAIYLRRKELMTRVGVRVASLK
jgi:DNA-directed RNA polymerase specialized sigma24 family protein